jgi:hypothetical protein
MSKQQSVILAVNLLVDCCIQTSAPLVNEYYFFKDDNRPFDAKLSVKLSGRSNSNQLDTTREHEKKGEMSLVCVVSLSITLLVFSTV